MKLKGAFFFFFFLFPILSPMCSGRIQCGSLPPAAPGTLWGASGCFRKPAEWGVCERGEWFSELCTWPCISPGLGSYLNSRCEGGSGNVCRGAWQTLSLNPTLYLQFLAWKAENKITWHSGPSFLQYGLNLPFQALSSQLLRTDPGSSQLIDTWTSGDRTHFTFIFSTTSKPWSSLSSECLGGQLVPLSVNS